MTSKNQLRTRRMSDSTFGFLLMVPALLVLLVVIAFPILKGIYASFCDYGLKELRKGIFDLKWNNFANYKIMLQKPKADTTGHDDLDEYDFGEDEDADEEPAEIEIHSENGQEDET